MASNGRRADLDGLRGVAILLTIFLHYISRGGHIPVHYLPPQVFNLLDSFWSGVDIFFVLSGFLIGGIILDNKGSEKFFKVFYLRRALRILPIALATILFAYLAMPALGFSFPAKDQVPPLAYLLFINNYWTASGVHAYSPLGPMWSLAIEEQFYLVAPMIMLIIGRHYLISGLTFILLVSPLARLFSTWPSAWDFTFYRLDGLAAGILIAIFIRNQRIAFYASANRHKIRFLVAFVVTSMLLFHMSSELSVRQRIAFGISLNTLAAASIIFYLVIHNNSQLAAALSRIWLVKLGQWSYFLYLFHMPILICVRTSGLPSPLIPLISVVICLVMACLSWRYLETPLIKMGKKDQYQLAKYPSHP